jgi:hypothetical protein
VGSLSDAAGHYSWHPLPCGCCDSGEAPYVVLPGSVLSALQRFLETFGAVFGEADWDATVERLSDEARRHYIAEGGTFLEPGIGDESRNWHNRGALLAEYRSLLRELQPAQFRVLGPPMRRGGVM